MQKIMKRIIIFALLFVSTFLVPAYAADTDLTYTDSKGITWTYVVNTYDDSACTISKCSQTSGEVVFPSEIDGRKVTGIGNDMYAYRNIFGQNSTPNVTSIVIPEGVTTLKLYEFYACTGLTSVKLPSTLTSIGSGVFANCSKLTEIKIPENVNYIGSSAFSGCTSLGSINLPKRLQLVADYLLNDCSSLTEIVIPENVEKIGNSAFSGCTGVNSIVIPEKVEIIDNYAFSRCIFTSITIPKKVRSLGSLDVFNKCLQLENIIVDENNGYYCSIEGVLYNKDKSSIIKCPAKKAFISIEPSVTKIKESAFADCYELTSIDIPDGVTTIESNAFEGCSKLVSIEIPDSVKDIGSFSFKDCTSLISAKLTKNPEYDYMVYVFINCTSLTSIEIPDNIKRINTGAFKNCTSLTSIELPDSITDLYNGAFTGCSLKSIKIPKNVRTLYSDFLLDCAVLEEIIVDEANEYYCSVDGVLYNKDKTSLLKYPAKKTSITFEDTVTEIEKYAFEDCLFTSIDIPDKVTDIEEYAFLDCTSLISIKLPNNSSFRTINNNVFENCTSLKSIKIPEYVTDIIYSAFNNCSSLTSVYFEGNPPSIIGTAFKNVDLDNLTLYYKKDKGWDTVGTYTSDSVTYKTKLWQYQVTFNTNYGTNIAPQIVEAGQTASAPEGNPSKSGYTFSGWFIDEGLTRKFDFSTVLTEDIILYAKWTAVPTAPSEPSGPSAPSSPSNPDKETYTKIEKEVSNTENHKNLVATYVDANGQTHIIPNGYYDAATGKFVYVLNDKLKDVEIQIKEAEEASMPTVNENHWAYDAISFLAQRGVVTNTESFAAETSVTRGEMVAYFTKCITGVDFSKFSGESKFSDVRNDDADKNYLNWAQSVGIVEGYPDGTFRPNETISRQEVCVIFNNFLNYYNAVTFQSNNSVSFKDITEIPDWSAVYVNELVAKGLVKGMPSGDGYIFAPTKNISHAELLTILYRIMSV